MSTGETVSSTLMVMALHAMGHDAISLSGGQAGIRTDKVHRKARIQSINPKRVHAELDRGRVVIVAGFQGLTQDANADITTLGRGGSDTTAVALAAALGGETCEIYTDVEGVYTADPRIVPEARKLDEISYDAPSKSAASTTYRYWSLPASRRRAAPLFTEVSQWSSSRRCAASLMTSTWPRSRCVTSPTSRGSRRRSSSR
jgi:hypothetical protein